MDQTELKARYAFWTQALQKLRMAYIALIDGGVKSYSIDDRQLTKFDLPALKNEIKEAEEKVDALECAMKQVRQRKAFGVIPRDW